MKRKNNTFGDIFRSIGEGFWEMTKGLLRLLLKIFFSFGLWLVCCYVLLGVVLHFACNFNPFDFSVYGVIYLSGGVACVVCCIILIIKNVFILPFRSIRSRRSKKEGWLDEDALSEDALEEHQAVTEEERLAPPISENFDIDSDDVEEEIEYLIDSEVKGKTKTLADERAEASSLLFDWVPERESKTSTVRTVRKVAKEIPDIYFSTLNPSVLVHEYKDRFELFKVVGDKSVSIGVEYK